MDSDKNNPIKWHKWEPSSSILDLMKEVGFTIFDQYMYGPVGVYVNKEGIKKAVEASTYILGSTEQEIKNSLESLLHLGENKQFMYYSIIKRINYDKLKTMYPENSHYMGRPFTKEEMNDIEQSKITGIRGAFITL